MPEVALLAPLWLALLPVALAVAALDAWRAEGRARRAGAGVRGLVLALLALGLARPAVRSADGTEAVVHILDATDSVDPAAAQGVAVEGPVVAAGAGLVVDGDPAAVAGPLDPALDPMAVAVGLLPATGLARVIVHSDGHLPLSEPPAGVAVEARALASAAPRPLVDLTTAAAPVAPGATVELTVTAAQAGPARVLLDDAVLAEPALVAGPQTVTVSLPEDRPPGLAALRVERADDALEVGVVVREPPTAWVVGGGREGRALAALLRAERFTVEERRPREVAGLAEGALDAVDLVVLAGPPTQAAPDRPAPLPADFVAALDAYVRQGGGLLATGGEFAFDQGGWDSSPLAPLLPITMDPQAEEEDGTVTLVIALDKSGSMAQSAAAPTSSGAAVAGIGARMGAGGSREGSKMQVVARAAIAAIQLLKPEDQVGVLAVDTQPDWVVGVQPAAYRVRLMEAVLGIGAGGGGIFVSDALTAARGGLQQGDTRLRHLILFADTADAAQQFDPVSGRPAEQLVAEMVKDDGISVSIIGIGQPTDRDVPFLRRLAREGGGRFVQTADVRGLETLFVAETQEVLGQGLEEDRPFRARRAGLHPALAGVEVGQGPRLQGMHRVTRKARARTLLEGIDDRPLLAVAQVGQGQVGAWTTDLGGRWARGWMRWSGSDRLFTQLARALARPEGGAPDLQLSVDRDTLRATSRGPDGLTVPRPGLTLLRDGAPLDLTLEAPGVWTARIGAAEGARFAVEAVAGDGAVLARLEGIGAPSPERDQRGDAAALAALERAGGGRPERRRGTPVAPWLLAAAVLLLPVEAWLRRRA